MRWYQFDNNKYIYIFLLSIIIIIFGKSIIFSDENYKDTVIEVYATGTKNELSHSSEVWINKIEVNGISLDLTTIDLGNEGYIQDEHIVLITKSGHIKIPANKMKSVKIKFQKHAWSGIVQVFNRDIIYESDLFSPTYEETEIFIEGIKTFSLKNLFYFFGSFLTISLLIAQFACYINYRKSISKLLLFIIVNITSCYIIKAYSLIYGINLNSEIFIILHILLCIGIYKFTKISFRTKIWGIGLGVLFGITQLVKTLFDYSNNTVSNLNEEFSIYYFYICLFSGIIVSLLLHNLIKFQKKNEIHSYNTYKKRNIILIIGLFYFIYWLTYFPAILTPDSINVLRQALNEMPLSNYQPLIYTLMEIPFVRIGQLIGDVRVGIASFSFCQMCFFVYCLSTLIVWLKQKGIPEWFCCGLIIYSCLNPLLGMYSITLWKDIAFALVVLLLTIELIDAALSNGKNIQSHKQKFKFFLLLCMMILLRNNGLLCVIFLLVGFALCKIGNKGQYLKVILTSIVVSLIVTGPMYSFFNIEKSNFAESMSIPLQQIGYVVKNNGIISREESDFINQILPIDRIKNDFTYATVDNIKFDEQFDNEFLNTHKQQFLVVWFQLLINNFEAYVKAYLFSVHGFYTIDSFAMACYEHSSFESANPYTINIIKYFTGIDSQLIVEQVIELGLNSSLLHFLVAPGFISWICILCITLSILKKEYKFIVAFLPAVGVLASIMLASPLACDFRYIYPLFLLLPVLISFIFFDFTC